MEARIVAKKQNPSDLLDVSLPDRGKKRETELSRQSLEKIEFAKKRIVHACKRWTGAQDAITGVLQGLTHEERKHLAGLKENGKTVESWIKQKFAGVAYQACEDAEVLCLLNYPDRVSTACQEIKNAMAVWGTDEKAISMALEGYARSSGNSQGKLTRSSAALLEQAWKETYGRWFSNVGPVLCWEGKALNVCLSNELNKRDYAKYVGAHLPGNNPGSRHEKESFFPQ